MKLFLMIATVLCVSVWTQGHVVRKNRQSRQIVFEEEKMHCTTPGPNIQDGKCIPLKNCTPLMALMMTSGLTNSVISFLRESTCGFEGFHPNVCCPPEVGLIEPVSIEPLEQIKTEEITAKPDPVQVSSEPSLIDVEFPNPDISIDEKGPQTTTESPKTEVSPVGTDTKVDIGTVEPVETPEMRLSCGKPSSSNLQPWLVRLTTLISLDISTGEHSARSCVGVLVTDQHIVTSAHCVEGIMISAQIGQQDIPDQDAFNSLLAGSSIAKVRKNDAYNKETLQNNVAVLLLESPVTFSDNIQPICLSQLHEKILTETDVFSAGWEKNGQAYRPKTVSITIPILCGSGEGSDFICAEFDGKSPCKETSGGPIMANKNGKIHLVGLMAANKDCESESPTRYTNINHHVPWIEAEIKKSNNLL